MKSNSAILVGEEAFFEKVARIKKTEKLQSEI
jgi:hypothetical protein